MIYTKFFKDLGKFDAPIAGGKGASLGEMTQAGIPVPGGYVVLSETFEKFIHATDLAQEIDAILDKVDHKAIHTIDQASEDIRALILSREMPDEIKTEIMESFAELNAEFVCGPIVSNGRGWNRSCMGRTIGKLLECNT
jgi:pyruvate,water dikinase